MKGASMAQKKMQITKKNPSKIGSLARRGGMRLLGGINPKKAAMDAVIGQPGMLMAQFFAKKFGKQGKSFFEENWEWENFAWAIAGAFAAGLAGNMIAPGKGQKMVEHGLALTLNKLVQDKAISKNETLKNALGSYDAIAARRRALLNPTAAQSMRQFDMYGNPQFNGVIAPVSSLGASRMAPVSSLGARFSTRNDLGKVSTPFRSAFIKN